MKLNLIVAMSQNRVIGRDGRLPWRLPQDLERFKKLTMGHPIIMGRKTHESIGRLLPGRRNVILTRQRDFTAPGAVVVHSLSQACDQLANEYKLAFVIGGAEVYRQALPRAGRIYLTLIHQRIDGDTFFPQWDRDQFVEVDRQSHDEPIRFSWITLDRHNTGVQQCRS